MNFSACSFAVLTLLSGALHAAESLVVHEWGTFTSFQDDRGRTIAGINVDDEPVPRFVHRVKDAQVFTTRSLPANWSQGAPSCHPDITLRLETPVIYFYPQASFDRRRAIDVVASFAGGWLTEFYPNASAITPGFPDGLSAATRGSLRWQGLRLTEEAASKLPATDSTVWLAPRAVQASVVSNAAHGEAEKYLFYRGVGRLGAPIVVSREGSLLTIALRDGPGELDRLPQMWALRVAPDGGIRYRRVTASEPHRATVALDALREKGVDTLAALQSELSKALREAGLFADEAAAMLATWRLSYFEAEGLRLFFVLPRHWTDRVLPLQFSVPADVTRVMLGRVELQSDSQRAALRQLLALPDADVKLPPIYARSTAAAVLMRTHSHSEIYRQLGLSVPRGLLLYESLGRFRDALLAHERSQANASKRQRLDDIMRSFSACIPREPS